MLMKAMNVEFYNVAFFKLLYGYHIHETKNTTSLTNCILLSPKNNFYNITADFPMAQHSIATN